MATAIKTLHGKIENKYFYTDNQYFHGTMFGQFTNSFNFFKHQPYRIFIRKSGNKMVITARTETLITIIVC